jgi:TatD DNase family protein
MIDTHCHIDLYKDPIQIANECERSGIITIGMTNLPSHFEMGYKHLLGFKNVRLALGMHPLHAESHVKELPAFIKNLSLTCYIGEIGLDFSREGISSKDIQLNTFKQILTQLSGKQKILSLHSRKAEKEVLSLLIQHRISAAIFHWYSGPLTLIEPIIKAGFYFSVNTAMIKSKAGQEIISRIPISNILTESDGPFIEIHGSPAKPKDVALVYEYLANTKKLTNTLVAQEIKNNFMKLITTLS